MKELATILALAGLEIETCISTDWWFSISFISAYTGFIQDGAGKFEYIVMILYNIFNAKNVKKSFAFSQLNNLAIY